jgi:hypothetical protein
MGSHVAPLGELLAAISFTKWRQARDCGEIFSDLKLKDREYSCDLKLGDFTKKITERCCGEISIA